MIKLVNLPILHSVIYLRGVLYLRVSGQCC